MGHQGHRVDGERAGRHRAHDRPRRRWHRERLSRSRTDAAERRVMSRPLLAIVAMVVSLAALAQPYPNKPIRLVAGYPPGGSGDFLTRLAAAELTKELAGAALAHDPPGPGPRDA